MKRLTFLAAAVAACLTTLAAEAKDISSEIADTSDKVGAATSDGGEKAERATASAACASGCDKAEKATVTKTTLLVSPRLPDEIEMDSGKPARQTKKQSGKFHDIVERYASVYGVPVSLAHAVIRVESNYRPNAKGQAGEIGLMQIKPATARMMGYSGNTKGLFDPETNIKYGMKYLGKAHELSGGTTCGTILRYNAGHGAKRMNPISSAYCKKVKLHLAGA